MENPLKWITVGGQSPIPLRVKPGSQATSQEKLAIDVFAKQFDTNLLIHKLSRIFWASPL